MNLRQALRHNALTPLALVGAGGKTTALFQLARQLPPPVIVSATAHLHIDQVALADRHIIAEIPQDLAILEGNLAGVVLVTGSLEGDRTLGLPADLMTRLQDICAARSRPLLIEADGSRQRPLKAPGENEPPIPPFVETVLVVAGLSGLGKPLTADTVHRPELFTSLAGIAPGEPVTAEAIARVLLHPGGGLKNIPPRARRVVLLNQADTPGLQAAGSGLANELLGSYQAVVIASLGQELIHAVHEPVAAIILAAGASTRFGSPKQLQEYNNQPFVRIIALTALGAGLSPVVVVTGAEAGKVESALIDLPIRICRNKGWSAGQSSSIRAGLAQLAPDTGATIFLLVDQPQVDATILRVLIERHAASLAPVIAPLVQGQRANPVLFDRDTFPALATLTGDVGGRAIFSKFPVTYLPWHDESLLIDIDTPADLARLKQGG